MCSTKTCGNCRQTKPVGSFNRSAASQDGRQRKCKACEAEYRRANRDKLSQKISAWKEKNRAHHLAVMTHGQSYRRGYKACECCTGEEIIEFLKTRTEGSHADHIVSAKEGGKHCKFNIQFLTPSEHYAKTSAENKSRREKHVSQRPVSF